MSSRNVWLRLWPVWAVPAALLLLDLSWMFGMRGALVGQGPVLARRVHEAELEVGRLEGQRRELQRTNDSLASLRSNLDALRSSQLATMKVRLLPFIVDVVKRAQEAGLRVERVSYAARRDEKSGLVYFTAAYSVQGSYEQIRRCVYLLESSPQFVLLDGLALRSEDTMASTTISIQLTTGTFFSDVDQELMQKLGVTEVRSGG
jgi:Tfp pilus assembly protein PilO